MLRAPAGERRLTPAPPVGLSWGLVEYEPLQRMFCEPAPLGSLVGIIRKGQEAEHLEAVIGCGPCGPVAWRCSDGRPPA